MVELIEEITKLTDKWYSSIGGDHHKDRDCHWYVETKWSYGQAPVYAVVHYGYIFQDVVVACTTYEEALKELKSVIEAAIAYKNQA